MKWLPLVLAGLLLFCAGCPSLQDFTRLDEMSAEELDRFASRTGARVEAAARVAILEEDLSVETALRLADALEGAAAGTAAPTGDWLADALDVEGYAGLALAIALSEADAALDRSGAYDSAGWAAGAEVLREIATGIRRAAGVEL